MNISTMYDLKKIIRELEVQLHIDGQDYAEKNVDVIIKNIKIRLLREYQLDFSQSKITDMEGINSAASALFTDAIFVSHSRLAGYLANCMYLNSISVTPVHINYAGLTRESFISFLTYASKEKYNSTIEEYISTLKLKFGSINICDEKKLILIIIVARELGFDEIASVIAQILYLGEKMN